MQVIGAAGPLPQAPPKPIVFMEDMTDAELAQAVSCSETSGQRR